VTVKILPAILISTVLAAAPAWGEDSVRAFRRALIDYFEPQGYVPVIVDRGYQIGDVVNIDGVDLWARAARCFPALKVPAPVKASIPDVVHVYDVGMSFGLRLKQLFSSRAGGDLMQRLEIRFTDVSNLSVALLDLRDALNRSACLDIAPLVDGTLAPLQPGQHPFFVVSELLMGKREARLQFATREDLELKTKEIARQFGDASLEVHGSNDGFVTLTSENLGPIAMKPVTIPKVVKVYSFQGVRGEEEESKLKWQPVECRGDGTCSQQFSPFADLVRAAEPRLSNEELTR
jgi:hypothetical protein